MSFAHTLSLRSAALVAAQNFDPRSVPGLILWAKSNNLNALANGADVTSWPTSHGSSVIAYAGADHPIFERVSINGNPSAVFAASRIDITPAVAGRSFFCAANWTSGASYSGLIGGGGGDYLMMQVGTTTELAQDPPGSAYVNGVNTPFFAYNTPSIFETHYARDYTAVSLGIQVGGASVNAKIGEVLIYATRPSDANLAKIRAYLYSKWLGNWRAIASAQANTYADMLLANGGTDIRANGEIYHLTNFATQLYQTLGAPCDFWPLRAAQNMGTGTVVRSFHGLSGTLVSSPAWDANGFSMVSPQCIQLPFYLGAGPTTRLIAYNPNNNTNYNQRDLLTFGSETGSQWDAFRCASQSGYLQLTHNTWASGVGIAYYNGLGVWGFYGLTVNGTNLRGSQNGTGFTNATEAASSPALVNGTIGHPVYGSLDGQASFALAAPKQFTDAAITTIFNAYKTTIGRGLFVFNATEQATVDANNYADLLLANGGANIRTNGQFTPLLNFATGLYTMAGTQVDFWAVRSTQNIGAGTKAYSFLGRTGTLINTCTWTTSGLNLNGSPTGYLDFGVIPEMIGSSPRSYYEVLTGRAEAFRFGMTLGESDAELFGGFYKNNGYSLSFWDGAVETVIPGGWDVPYHTFYGWDGSAIRGRTKCIVAGDQSASSARATHTIAAGRHTYWGQRPYSSIDGTDIKLPIFVPFGFYLTTTQQSTLMNLYRDTIGAGLGLP